MKFPEFLKDYLPGRIPTLERDWNRDNYAGFMTVGEMIDTGNFRNEITKYRRIGKLNSNLIICKLRELGLSIPLYDVTDISIKKRLDWVREKMEKYFCDSESDKIKAIAMVDGLVSMLGKNR